jgi:hypothetical protein
MVSLNTRGMIYLANILVYLQDMKDFAAMNEAYIAVSVTSFRKSLSD